MSRSVWRSDVLFGASKSGKIRTTRSARSRSRTESFGVKVIRSRLESSGVVQSRQESSGNRSRPESTEAVRCHVLVTALCFQGRLLPIRRLRLKPLPDDSERLHIMMGGPTIRSGFQNCRSRIGVDSWFLPTSPITSMKIHEANQIQKFLDQYVFCSMNLYIFHLYRRMP